ACGTLLVGVVGLWGQSVGGRKTGFWAAGICAVSPLALWYSTDTRVYSLYLLLAAISLWQFTRALQSNSSMHWFWFSLSSLAGVYTHYYFGLLIAISGLILLATKFGEKRIFHRGLTSFFFIALFCLPDFLFLKEDLGQAWGYSRTSEFSLAAFAFTFFSFFSGYSLGPSLRDLHVISHTAALKQFIPWLVLLGFPLVILLVNALRHTPSKRGVNWWLQAFCFGILPVLIVGFVSQQASFGYNARHALWCYIPLVITVSLGIAWGHPRWLMNGCAILLLGVSLFAIYQRNYSVNHRTEDSRAVAQYLLRESAREIPLFVLSGYMQETLEFYLPEHWHVLPLGETKPDTTVPSVYEQISAAARGEHQIFWLAYSRPFHGDPQGEILKRLQQEYRLELIRNFSGFKLYRGHFR
ncbi:MAG: glycosyltransferase family 39 protein, partial [Planctomycetota bacterium]